MVDKNDKDKKKEILDLTINSGLINQNASNNLGITQEYNSKNRAKLWDSSTQKSQFKEKKFNGKETYVDPISEETLHKSQIATQNKYHSKWSKHSAETDHVNAIKDAHNIAKHNPFLSDDNFREIINCEENYRILSKSDNTSKGAKNDWEIILDKKNDMSIKGRKQMAKEKINADIALQKKFASKTAENIGKEFTKGATDALVSSAIPLMAYGVEKLCKVASGEESIVDASKEMAKTTVDVSVKGSTNQLALDVAKAQLSKNKLISSIANSEQISKMVTVSFMVKDSTIKYVNGEISGQEFIDEIGQNGLSMVAGMIGGQIGSQIGEFICGSAGTMIAPGIGTATGITVGEVVGRVIGTIITTVACSAIVCAYNGIASVRNTLEHLDDYKLKENEIKLLEKEALKEMENQREKFKNIVEKEYQYWDEEMQKGFDMMLRSACEETFNLQGVTDGLDKILSIFGKEVAFKNINEYESQLDSTLKLNF